MNQPKSKVEHCQHPWKDPSILIYISSNSWRSCLLKPYGNHFLTVFYDFTICVCPEHYSWFTCFNF